MRWKKANRFSVPASAAKADAAKAAAGFLKKASAARRKEDPFKLKQRLTAFLLRRGYTWDVVAPVVKRLVPKGDPEPETARPDRGRNSGEQEDAR